MGGIVFIGIVISIFLLIWTKFNVSEHKSISTRWAELLAKEEERESRYKKIDTAVVTLSNGRVDDIPNVYSYVWDRDVGALRLYNLEDKAVSLYNISEVIDVQFIREGEAGE